MEVITHSNFPEYIGQLLAKIDRIETIIASYPISHEQPQTKYVAMKEAERITSKSANALRVQISLGNLRSIKKGSRHYFEREYLEKWIVGDIKEERS